MQGLPTIPNIPTPFASASTAKRSSIPTTDQSDAVSTMMSWNLGFPQAFSRSIANGGRYVQRSDFNTIFNLITTALQYLFAGGEVEYNESFQKAIGGYPKGAVVHRRRIGESGGKQYFRDEHWLSMKDNNNVAPPGGNNEWTLLDPYVSTSDMAKWVNNTNAVEAWAIKEAIESIGGFGPPDLSTSEPVINVSGTQSASEEAYISKDGWLCGEVNGCSVTVGSYGTVYYDKLLDSAGYVCLPVSSGDKVAFKKQGVVSEGHTVKCQLFWHPYKRVGK